MCAQTQGKAGTLCSESPGTGAAAAPLHALSPLSALISRHLFQQGEIIELVVRPSAWWLVFSSWRTLLLCAAIIVAGLTFAPGRSELYVELGVMGGLVRLMWATVKWMARIHLLTNMRAMTMSGVFNTVVVECPLRRLGHAHLTSPLHERMLLLGSLELVPIDEAFPTISWETIRRPSEVHRKIQAAIARARQNGSASGA
jgi:hypothetical protein